MLHFYSGSNQIPGTCEQKPFVLPKYPASTTDPTFYEPTATRIANMKRAAGGFQGIFDYKGSVKNSEEGIKQLSSATVDIRFTKHGMTKEEISQITMQKSLEADSLISDKKKKAADKSEELKKELQIAEAVSKAASKSEENTNTDE